MPIPKPKVSVHRRRKPVARARKDAPPVRGYDGEHRLWKVLNQDPRFHYVWVPVKSYNGTGSVEYYRDCLGYDVCVGEKGPEATRPAAGRTAHGQDHVRGGMVLMRIAREEVNGMVGHDFLVKHGENGDGGQSWADEIEYRLANGGGEDDPTKDFNNRHIKSYYETSELTGEN